MRGQSVSGRVGPERIPARERLTHSRSPLRGVAAPPDETEVKQGVVTSAQILDLSRTPLAIPP